MFYLACTRFNETTYTENINYKKKNNEKVIYGTPMKIREIYPYESLIFIAEMNNPQNKIEGIGLIKNLLVHDKRHYIHENDEYNRYIYKGNYWLSREQINEFEPKILEIFDNILFKGKSHLKCRIGITIITEKLFTHWDYDLQILKNMIKQLFIHYFKCNIDNDDKNDKSNDEEYFEIEIIPKNIKKRKKLRINEKYIELL
jgi:hypothetical protein